jgi:hypothetical protein
MYIDAPEGDLEDVCEGGERNRVSRFLHEKPVVHQVKTDGKIHCLKMYNVIKRI